MTAETALRVAMAAGRHFTHGEHRNLAVIGKDTRLSNIVRVHDVAETVQVVAMWRLIHTIN